MTTADVGIRSGNVLVPYVSVTKQTKWLDINTYVTVSGATTPSGRTKSSGVAFARFSADSAGQWYMEAEISITMSDTVTAVVLEIAGVTFKTGINQAMSHISIDGRAYAYAVGNNIQIESTAAAGTHVVSANVMLQSEPTWTSLGTTAVAALEGVIAADVYIMPAVPGTSAGIVPAAGLPGNITGSAVASGYVGELKLNVTNSVVTATYGGATGTIATGSLTAGVYFLTCEVSGGNGTRPSSGIGSQTLELIVNGVAISTCNYITEWPASGGIPQFVCTLVGYVIVPAGATHTASVVMTAVSVSGTPTNYTCTSRAVGALKAIRIA